MIRGSNNWKCKCDLIIEIKASSFIPGAIHKVQERWGRARTLNIYNRHIRPKITIEMLTTEDFSELY